MRRKADSATRLPIISHRGGPGTPGQRPAQAAQQLTQLLGGCRLTGIALGLEGPGKGIDRLRLLRQSLRRALGKGPHTLALVAPYAMTQ